MRLISLSTLFLAIPFQVSGNERQSIFTDQAHYELVYEYEYQINFVERLIFECTADRAVWRSFGYATASLSNAYKRHVLGTSIFQRDPFTGQRLISRLGQELILHSTRSSVAHGDPADPVLMAQRDVLRMVELYGDDLDILCDFAFWEEVGHLELIVNDLLADTENRLDTFAFEQFTARAEDGLPLIRRLFDANPLKEEGTIVKNSVVH